MQNYDQLFLQRLFFGDATTGWAQAVYLAGMFAIVIWRRESVVNWWLFRTSYLLFGAAIFLPHLVVPATQMAFANRAGGGGGDGPIFTYIIANSMGPALLAAAIICGLGSMLPRLIISHSSGPSAPHPLD